MAKKFLIPIDLGGNEIRNVVVHLLGTDPGSPSEGQAWVNTTSHALKIVLNGTVRSIPLAGLISDSDIAASAAIALSKLATNPLARANHTGTQTASTISDFDTQVRTSRLDQMATPTAVVNHGGQRATNAGDPSSGSDLATKNYVDTVASGQDWKASVRVASTGNVNIASAPSSIDGVTLANGDRVLLKSQTTGSENGIYVFNGSGSAMTRATDADSSAKVTAGLTVAATEGTANADTVWLLTTNDTVTLGTTALTFSQLPGAGSYTAGTGLTLTGNQFSLTSPVAIANGGTNSTTAAGARSNLGAPGKYATTITGDGSATQFTANHAFGTTDVVVAVYDASDDEVMVDVHRTDANNVRITFATAPANGVAYRVVVIG